MTDIPADGTSAFATASSEGAQEQPWHRVADSNALDVAPGGSRLHVCVEGRYVSIIRHGGGVYCLDSNCHHAGGPLALGEIEEVDSHPCLVCPWHYYRVSLDGEKFYQSADADAEGKLHAGEWRSVGPRQRVHGVELRPDGIFVQLHLSGSMPSDEYACNQSCGKRVQSGSLRLAAAELDGARRSASPMRGTPPASPRAFPEAEDVWPADLVPDRSGSLSPRWHVNNKKPHAQ